MKVIFYRLIQLGAIWHTAIRASCKPCGYKTVIVKLFCFVSLIVLMLAQFGPAVSALSDAQLKLFQQHINYFDVDVCGSTSNDTSSAGGGGTGKGVTFTTQMTIDNDGVGSDHGDTQYHQSQTSYANGRLNADKTNFIALAPGWAQAHGLQLGDVAMVERGSKTAYAVYGDNYQGDQIHGEGSVHLSIALGGDAHNTIPAPVHYTVYPGSHKQIDGSVDQDKIDQIGGQVSGGPAAEKSPTDQSKCCPPDGSTMLSGKNNEEKIWNFLVGEMGLTNIQTAGVMGNMQQESGFSPTSTNPSSGAYGIAQWYAGRRAGLEAYASSQGKDKSDLGVQLKYLEKELKGSYKTTVLNPIKASTSLPQATRIWLEHYEIPCSPPGSACNAEMSIRLPNAVKILDKYGRGGGGGGGASDSCSQTTASTKIDLANLDKDSTNIACAPGTQEIKNDSGYREGKKIPVKICEVTNLPQLSGDGAYNGHASVNSRVSGAVYAMIEAAKKDGVKMSAASTFRTMADQQSHCPCDGVHVAKPGYSNHQLGVAIDFGGNGQLMDKSNPMWKWLNKNADKFGYKPYTVEDWHWSPYGN